MNRQRSIFIFLWLVFLTISGCQAPHVIPTSTPTVTSISTSSPTATPSLAPSPTLTRTPTITPTSTHTPFPLYEPGVEVVSFPVSNDIHLSGTIYHAVTDTIVIFAHMGGLDQTTWADFAQKVADNGVSAFTYDMRCHGKSECFGLATDSKNYQDLVTIMDILRQRGYKYFVCVGGSMGGGACINVSLREELAGLMLIASPKQFAFETKTFPENLVSRDIPKLFIYNESDHYRVIRTAMPELYNRAPEPKKLVIFPGQWHGTELFDSPYAEQFSMTLMDFLLSVILK